MAMISFFMLRGHSLNELASLSTKEKLFYYAVMSNYGEEAERIQKGR